MNGNRKWTHTIRSRTNFIQHSISPQNHSPRSQLLLHVRHSSNDVEGKSGEKNEVNTTQHISAASAMRTLII